MPRFSIDTSFHRSLVPIVEDRLAKSPARRFVSLKREGRGPRTTRRWKTPSFRVVLAFLPLTCAVLLHGLFAALLALVVTR